MTDFREKNVLITGAGSGIGRLLAEKIAAAGARAILWDIDEAALADVGRAIEGRGHKVSSYRCDVSDADEIKAGARRVLDDWGPVDILINNAGIVTGKPILESEDAEIRRTFDINTLAHFWTVRAFLPGMLGSATTAPASSPPWASTKRCAWSSPALDTRSRRRSSVPST
jgi:all-trans-retinol dehydrogenase (NAD+)